ncbi:hypothetical protein [Actinophytocola sp.]|uniref:hypothetical protein n=1 Tax=Actinophytocola sp. TaxID=1872138 RepID=UPI00389A1FC7
MSEEDVRGGLRDAVAEEPPLDFDPDALVTVARQQVRRRRALMAAGAATVAVAVAAVALPVALGRPPAQVEAGQQSSSAAASTTTATPTPSHIDWPPPNVQPVHYTPDELRDRGRQMTLHLRKIAPSVLSNATGIDVSEFGGEATGEYYENQTSVNGTLNFTVDGAVYSVVVQVWVPGGADDLLTTACAEKTCQQIGEQDGGPLVAGVEDLNQFVAGGKISAVYHLRKNGSVVEIAAYNYQLDGTPKTMSTIPVSQKQLTRLAIDPDLGL